MGRRAHGEIVAADQRHAEVEAHQLHRDLALVVIHRLDDVVVAALGAQEDGVGGKRAITGDAFRARSGNGRGDLGVVLVAEVAAVAGVGVEGGNRDARCVETDLLHALVGQADIFVGLEQVAGQDADLWPALEAATKAALEQLRSMRRQEGQALGRDLLERIDAIANSQAKVETRAPQRIEEARNRLHERIEDLFSDERIDRDRLEFEIAILADKLDITEECVRLTSHLDLFREALKSSEPVGRKLNFLIQEINREVNTIGSKANDAQVAHLAVEMKEELERIREQVQNIE